MSEAILCPQVGQDLTEAKVVELHVKLGDTVKRGDIVAVVESEKASFEVEAFAAGVVVQIPYKVGDTATVLEPLVVLAAPGEKLAEVKAAGPARKVPVASRAEVLAKRPVMDRKTAREAGSSALRSSPLARKTAETHGIEISSLEGSGPRGAIVLRDVEGQVTSSTRQVPLKGLSGLGAAGGLNLKRLRDGSGHPVVFIHGFGADISAWRQLGMQIKLEAPLLVIDLPGHGESPDATGQGFKGLVDAVAQTLQNNEHTTFHLVGHSLGAAVATALTARRAFKALSLVLMSPAGLGPTVDDSFVASYLDARSEAALGTQMRRLVRDPANLPDAMVRATFAARQSNDLIARQRKVADAVFEGSTQLFSVQTELAAYQGPCKVILGRSDAIIPPAETAAAIPGHVALHRLDNVGHLPFAEAQPLVMRLIIETVRSASGSPTKP